MERSPLLGWPDAVAVPDGIDEALPWHFGDPAAEQRALTETAAVVDRGNRDVLVVPGADRLSWLHAVTSQHLEQLPDGRGTQALVLDPNGHVEHHLQLAHVGGVVTIDTEPGQGPGLLAYLEKMRFLNRVEPALATAATAVITVGGAEATAVLTSAGLPVPGPGEYDVTTADGIIARRMPRAAVDLLVPREQREAVAKQLREAGARPAGMWAWEAERVAAGQARLGFDTDHRSLPHELGWIPGPHRDDVPVHLNKGCYRGQETVARIQNLGRPPRLMVLLHLDGTDDLPETGAEVRAGTRNVGRVGTVARHVDLGPVALAVIKRNVAEDEQARTALTAGDTAASAEPIPGIGG